jgi:hypothetical protein
MKSEKTLQILDHKTRVLGDHLREFERKVCPAFLTRELPREAAARQRRGAKDNARKPAAAKLASFNISTYKVHALGDYVESIRQFGSTDSYSTEPVSCSIHQTSGLKYFLISSR